MSDVCEVNRVSERVNEWCVWESVGPTNVKEREKKREISTYLKNINQILIFFKFIK